MQFPDKLLENFLSRLLVDAKGCWLWQGTVDQGGYGSLNYRAWPQRAHRLSWQIHRGEIPEGLYVLHKCDVRNCVNPDHLFIGTALDNMRDMYAKGRQPNRAYTGILKEPTVKKVKAEKLQTKAKQANQHVAEIRELFATGTYTQTRLAQLYRVSISHIHNIVHNKILVP